ncbi:uncharacterized protein LOC131841794 [Achroia grisella]|uniref:uncharacterized protein LOC131841794 n=1 Tax=Achroia grisella TaxID=688607 RepID=UPI0027D336F5|nr:uncharacterized protein LOC131841794 [Achroia grisella]
MNSLNLASGDDTTLSPRSVHVNVEKLEDKELADNVATIKSEQNEITTNMIDKNEMKLKHRIGQCREIIESFKMELKEEKAKLEKESKIRQCSYVSECARLLPSPYPDVSFSDIYTEELPSARNIYEASVDSKLKCDENLIEYEKQLQKYQNTLNMVQLEKKNIIRKQMLAKAYRFKILEVENQCNIELLRIKQSLQCLKPLQMIVNKWKCETDKSSSDLNNLELMPIYSELSTNSTGNAIRFSKDSNYTSETLEKLVQGDLRCTSSN